MILWFFQMLLLNNFVIHGTLICVSAMTVAVMTELCFFFNDIWGKFIMQWWISWFVANSYSQVMHYRFSKINARDTRCFIRHSVMTWNLFTVNTNIYRIYFLNSYLGSTIIIFSCFNVSGFFASYLLISTSQWSLHFCTNFVQFVLVMTTIMGQSIPLIFQDKRNN